MTWVIDYIKEVHTPAEAKQILADIDRRYAQIAPVAVSMCLIVIFRIAAAPPFPGLRRFPEGRRFKQWTGDDSKALMKVDHVSINVDSDLSVHFKVFLPAIVGYVPDQMVRALSSFMEFCYLVRRSVIDEDDIVLLETVLQNFHRDRSAFDCVRPNGYSLPRQHSMMHYVQLIREFGAPNGLCSSITESKHIKAVKEPWRRSSHFRALGQMLVTNQRIDKLAAVRVDFHARGMLSCPLLTSDIDPNPVAITTSPIEEDEEEGAVDGDILAEVTLARKHSMFDLCLTMSFS